MGPWPPSEVTGCTYIGMAGWINGWEGRWVWQGRTWWWCWWCMGLGGEGKFDTAGGVALVAGHALQAAVVVQVAGAGCAHTVQLSMGELRAFHVHLDLLCSRGCREMEREREKKRIKTFIVRTAKQILYSTSMSKTFGSILGLFQG